MRRVGSLNGTDRARDDIGRHADYSDFVIREPSACVEPEPNESVESERRVPSSSFCRMSFHDAGGERESHRGRSPEVNANRERGLEIVGAFLSGLAFTRYRHETKQNRVGVRVSERVEVAGRAVLVHENRRRAKQC